MTKDDFLEKLDKYQKELYCQEKAKSSIDSYVRYARVFINYLEENKDIDKGDVIEFKNHMLNVLEYSASSINTIIVCVNKFLNYCNLADLKVKKVKTTSNTSIDEIMSTSDYKRLLRYANKLNMNDMYLIMKIFAETGIRCEELRFFTYEKVNAGMYISVRNKGKTRDIIIRQDLRREILKYCKLNEIDHGYIFFSPKNREKMLHRSTIFRRLKKIAGAARVKKSVVYPHAFRHYFSIMFLENGGNVIDLKNILGHSSLETTNIYVLKTKDDLRKQLERMKFE